MPRHMMEEHMTDSTPAIKDVTPRRSFFGHLGGAVVLGLAGLVPKPLYAQTPAARPDGPNWPGTLKGRHRQVGRLRGQLGIPARVCAYVSAPKRVGDRGRHSPPWRLPDRARQCDVGKI